MKPKIVIAIASGRALRSEELNKHLAWAGEFAALVPGFEVSVINTPEPREAHALNLMIDEFRQTPGAEWFVAMRHDCEISPVQVFELFATGKAVAGALVAGTQDWEAQFYPDVKPEENGALAVPELGMGCKIVHRSVFERIVEAESSLAYLYDNSGRTVVGFCQETLAVFGEYKRLLSASAHLDMLCRKAGIEVFTSTKAILRRVANGKELYRPWEHTRLPPPVCAEDLPEAKQDTRQIAIYLQYCSKDGPAAFRLAEQIKDASPNMFLSEGKTYPAGPNQTALELLRKDWWKWVSTDVKAVLLIEPDCCPLTPDWLEQLSRDWDRCAAAGKLIMGSWHPVNIDHPTLGHINGNLMFSPDLAKRIAIPDVPDDKPWDTYLADVFAPAWARTGLIKNLNRHRTASVKQLTTPECGTKPPVLIHGVRDESAWNYTKTLCK